MLNIKLRTEYSFRTAYGPVKKVIDTAEGNAVGICDTGTWGHVKKLARSLYMVLR